MGSRENKVEKYLKSEIDRIGGLSRKWVSPGAPGVPDQILIIRGSVFFVEVKTVDGGLQDSQKREIPRLQKHGAIVYIVYGKSGVDKLIDHIERTVEHVANINTEDRQGVVR